MQTQFHEEPDARRRWCPFALFGVYGNKSDMAVNRHPETSESGVEKCLASGCMAWETDPSNARRGRCGRS